MEERLKAACGFRKPQLPPELPLRDWQAAAGNLEEFDCRAPLVTDDRDSCAVCQPGSAMIHIVRLVLGTGLTQASAPSRTEVPEHLELPARTPADPRT